MDKPVNIMNKSEFFTKTKTNIFSNIKIILFMSLIALIFIGYAIYNYIKNMNNTSILESSSYYSTDIALFEPIFQNTSKTINECISICENDITCDGITYNSDTQACIGTKKGIVRSEKSNYSAWVKPPSDKIGGISEIGSKDFTKSLLIGYTKTMKVIDGKKIQNPYKLGYFSYSFNLTIYDFYKNFGSWRHIFHKGTQIIPGTILNYQSWENLIVEYPIQNIGVWLAPFTNNLRIAVTTTSLANENYGSYSDAFLQKCDSLTKECYVTDTPNGKWTDKSHISDGSIPKTKLDTYIEYFDNDLQNIPINTQINITINFRGNDVEILINGKIIKAHRLDGIPQINNSSLYVMNDKSIGGEISNLLYYPDALLLEDIQTILELQPKIKEVI